MAPLLRSITFGMPPMFPVAICMAFELATYGAVSGALYQKLPKKKSSIYVALLVAMVLGGIVVLGALICLVCTFFVVNKLVSLNNDDLYY